MYSRYQIGQVVFVSHHRIIVCRWKRNTSCVVIIIVVVVVVIPPVAHFEICRGVRQRFRQKQTRWIARTETRLATVGNTGSLASHVGSCSTVFGFPPHMGFALQSRAALGRTGCKLERTVEVEDIGHAQYRQASKRATAEWDQMPWIPANIFAGRNESRCVLVSMESLGRDGCLTAAIANPLPRRRKAGRQVRCSARRRGGASVVLGIC